jgi:hypothetical protein
MKNFSTLAASALFLAANATSATTLVGSDNFQQDLSGTIIGNTGGTGWASAWQSATGTTSQVVAEMGGNRALQLSGTNENAAFRVLTSTINQDVFVDFTFQYGGNNLGNNDFLGLWFGSSAGPNIGLKANCGDGSCGNDLFVRTNGNTGAFLPDSALQQDQSYHLYGHLYKSAGSTNYNKFDAWINPTALEMNTLTGADASFSANSGIASFNTIGFRTANLDNGVSVRIDDLQISTVPEPGTIALLGLSLLGMAGVSRRRRG